MHVNAFFDYLMDNPHPYWTQIPNDPNPVCEDGRDGVAAEDDMALRALLPQIRPRRGRKRPGEEDLSKSPSQRPRLDSPAFGGEARVSRPDSLDPWTAHPDGRGTFMFPPVDPRSSVLPETNSAFPWSSNDVSREPMSAYPQSAMTPSTRGTFWGDPSEPRSAISPKAKALGRRHGAKVVSSAWRSGGVSTGGRPRGRPPVGRLGNETPLSAIPDERREFQASPLRDSIPQSSTTPTQPMPPPEPIPKSAGPTSAPTSAPAPITTPTSAHNSRPPRGRLSLQVPERAGGPVRLATPPPPVVMVNGKTTVNGNAANDANETRDASAEDSFTIFDRTSAMFTAASTENRGDSSVQFDRNDSDRTNCDEIEAQFVADILECTWYDDKGQPGPPGSVDEAMALVRAVIESISKQALTKEAFLINLSALAGVKYIMKAGNNTVQRIEIGPDYTKYNASWGLRYGSVSGKFSLTETVPHSRWKKGFQKKSGNEWDDVDVPAEGDAAADYWRKRYVDLIRVMNKRNDDAVLSMSGLRKDDGP